MHIFAMIPHSLRSFSIFGLAAYTLLQMQMVYFPKLTLERVHECLVHVDEQHCGQPSRDWLSAGADPASVIKFSEKQKNKLLRHYAELFESITPTEDCLIGVGYNTCYDINFRAINLFESIKPEIATLKETMGREFVPRVHPEIATLDAFIETFLYFFSQGSNAEFTSLDKDLFFLFHDRLNEKEISKVVEIGGHSSVWALRSQVENCRAYVTPPMADFYLKELPLGGGENLVLPLEHLEVSSKANRKSRLDYHLVFEFRQGDQILGYKAPRSNRFYFVHDPNGASIQQMEVYHETLDKVSEKDKPYRHLIGGFQLMQRLSMEEAETRLHQMANLWSEARQEGPGPEGQKHVFHVEFGHFSKIEHFELFEKYAVSNADSLGMNEVEMQMLLDYWAGQLGDINDEKDTHPTISDVLKMTDQIFSQAKEKRLPLSRLHLHPFGSFLMCYDKTKWYEAREAIVKGSIVMPKYCVTGADYQYSGDWLETTDNFVIPDLPRVIRLPNGELIELSDESLTYDFSLNAEQGTHCFMQFFVLCKNMKKTAGMGDTISSSGWIYHEPKPAPLT